MLLVRTRLAPSGIHGLGVFAGEAIAAGQPVWEFAPGIDLVIPQAEIDRAPEAFRAYLDTYGYRSPDLPGAGIVLSCDNAKYLNHAEDPNCQSRGRVNRALRAIAPGDEITCDYRACVEGWTGFV